MRLFLRRRPLVLIVAALAAILVAGLGAAVGGAVPPASANASSSLRVFPQPFTGGQMLTWRGNLGVTGKRPLMLQRNLNRRGDKWKDVQLVGTSAGDGSYSFRFPGPVMDYIKFRVRSGRIATPPVVFRPKAQEAVLTRTSPAVAGESFTMQVNSVPDLRGRINLPGPVLEGRDMALQRREHTSLSRLGYESPWRDVATSTVGGSGRGSFSVTEGDPGTYVYRARLGDWTERGDEVGWFPSFPVTVQVQRSSYRPAATAQKPARALASAGRATTAATRQGSARTSPIKETAGTNSGSKFRWFPSRFDFDWPYGESLHSPPFRGTRKQGRWIDSSTGNGRAVLGNGALELASQERSSDERDYGTTSALLRGNAAAFGRWEVRLRTRPSEKGQGDFRTILDLVPESPGGYTCGANVIKIADVRPHSSVVRYSARSRTARKRWNGRRGGVALNNRVHMYAVEVSRRHITWFMDGRVLGTVRHRNAAPAFARTIRLRLVGKGADSNRMKASIDWVRHFPLNSGRQVRWGKRPAARGWNGGC